MAEFAFRLDRHGVAHVVVAGWATALCSAQTVRPAPATGSPCPRCLQLAGERLA